MTQLLLGLRRLAACHSMLLARGCTSAANTAAAHGAAQPEPQRCSAAATEASSSAGAICGVPAVTGALASWLRPCSDQISRQASGAAASTPSAMWRSQQRSMHFCAATGAATAEPAQQTDGTGADHPRPAQLTPGRVQNPPMPPWTPTRELKKRNFLPRRMGFMIQTLEGEAYEKARREKNFPQFGPGDVVEVKLALPENQRRTIPVRGVVISIRSRGIRTSFTLLNNITGGGNIERTFPLFCPTIQELRVVQKQKVKAKRAKLYYLRDRKPTEFKV